MGAQHSAHSVHLSSRFSGPAEHPCVLIPGHFTPEVGAMVPVCLPPSWLHTDRRPEKRCFPGRADAQSAHPCPLPWPPPHKPFLTPGVWGQFYCNPGEKTIGSKGFGNTVWSTSVISLMPPDWGGRGLSLLNVHGCSWLFRVLWSLSQQGANLLIPPDLDV